MDKRRHLHSFTCAFPLPTSLGNLKELNEAGFYFFPFDVQKTERLFRPCRASERQEEKVLCRQNECNRFRMAGKVALVYDAKRCQFKALGFNCFVTSLLFLKVAELPIKWQRVARVQPHALTIQQCAKTSIHPFSIVAQLSVLVFLFSPAILTGQLFCSVNNQDSQLI